MPDTVLTNQPHLVASPQRSRLYGPIEPADHFKSALTLFLRAPQDRCHSVQKQVILLLKRLPEANVLIGEVVGAPRGIAKPVTAFRRPLALFIMLQPAVKGAATGGLDSVVHISLAGGEKRAVFLRADTIGNVDAIRIPVLRLLPAVFPLRKENRLRRLTAQPIEDWLEI